ncbi:MSMEG_1061 family FMN-dependent PPOX-type flavoprotein [Candidatus Oleimmundimicrobium sp.]|uniref:MSMEG_1061 family FMN-dependent PPOX-type flavoprotein n=1 Tax=Candidatus Oleimmundimicrobium sp. TaxID=3060597 RepID=UPI002715E183|nr:MSMEG_1061 family FMN-dependent PPOX-type flavoprotein [Candidatus Oleimmundimicrobium sp.]MDO8886351.1 pyridoxamine 5'-phosphate oxidase family protein [Candidatus Oleimmundimicrobium sp.]
MNRIEDFVTSVEQLREIIPEPDSLITNKAIDHLDDLCQRFIAASPFLLVASRNSTGGLDISPRGDPAGFVRILDNKTLVIPDRPGNKRVDTFGNVLGDPHVSLIFLIPGVGGSLRVMGTARIAKDPWLLETLRQNNKVPRLALVISVEKAMGHCARCMARSGLWQPELWPDITTVPTVAEITLAHARSKSLTLPALSLDDMQASVDRALNKLY